MLRETRANEVDSSSLIARDRNGLGSNGLPPFNYGPLFKNGPSSTHGANGLDGLFLVGLNMVLVQINKKGILSVRIVKKMNAQKILVEKYMENLKIENKDKIIKIMLIKLLLIIRPRKVKETNPRVELSTLSK